MSAQHDLRDASGGGSGGGGRESGDGSDGHLDDEDFLDSTFDEFEEQEQQDALTRELVRGGFFGGDFGEANLDGEIDMSDLRPRSNRREAADSNARPGGSARGALGSARGGRSNTARMLEALEALSQEAEGLEGSGGGVPQSLRGLLEQLHVGVGVGADSSVMSGMFPFMQLLQGAGSNPRFQRILSGLSELCETLSLSNEEVLAVSGFSVDSFVPAVSTLIRFPTSMDVLLLAARALSSILELFPSAAIPKAIAEQVIPSLCEKLLEIEYMDVAELALQILERIVCKSEAALSASSTSGTSAVQLGAQYRLAVIQENGIVALLQFVDFFPLEIQRRAARIVCEVCTDFPLAMEGKLQQALPYISNLLHSFDSEILQSSCACLQKLGESTAFSENSAFASMIASDEICELLVQRLTSYASLAEPSGGGSTSVLLSPTGYTNIMRFLSCVLSSIPSDLESFSILRSASHLRFVRLPPIVTTLLAKQEVISENQLLRETLKLVIAVLPIAEEISPVNAVPPSMLTLAHEILPLMIRVYDVTSRADLRYDCLGVIFRSCSLIYGRQRPFMAQERLELSRLATFFARVLRPRRSSTATSTSPNPARSTPVLVEREVDLLPVQLTLGVVEIPLQHTDARNEVKELFERHGVASVIRFYASSPKEQGTEDDSDLSDVQKTSARLVKEYLGSESPETSVVGQLQHLVEDLSRAQAASSTDNNAQSPSLREVLLKLRELNFITAHEIAHSGLVKVLIELLSSGEGQNTFSQVILTQPVQDSTSGELSFVTSLVRCLQDAISSEKDAFSIDCGVPSKALTLGDSVLSSGSVANDLDQLTQHIKVRVLIEESKPEAAPEARSDNGQQSTLREEQEEPDEAPFRWMKRTSLRRNGSSYKANKSSVHDTVVLVEPLARIETMEDFIAGKLFGRSGNGDSILDALAGDGSAIDDENDQEVGGEFNNDNVKQRRVKAVYTGHPLPTDMSILEAIVKFGRAEPNTSEKAETEAPSASAPGPPSMSHSRIWTSSPHEITFRVVTPLMSTSASLDSARSLECARGEVNTSTSAMSSSKLTKGASSGEWWDDVWDLLLLMKLLREQTTGRAATASLSFVNSFLSLQVNRALQQPVRVVTNSLPQWCFRLVNEFSFVLDFETRYHFMYATTCGCSRAIQYLCRSVWKKAVTEEPVTEQRRPNSSGTRRRHRDGSSRGRTSALDNISQMVKLPRLKVRVARSRLLQSAMKLLAIYGGKKAVIEIEFLGEVGTGLGPTTEFFTLVCQQIQSQQLQMWKDDGHMAEPSSSRDGNSSDAEQKREVLGYEEEEARTAEAQNSLSIRGYHRVAVYHCPECKALHIPTCSVHRQLLTHEKKAGEATPQTDAVAGGASKPVNTRGCPAASSSVSSRQPAATNSIPQCSHCLDEHDWHSAAASCDCKQVSSALEGVGEDDNLKASTDCTLKWWILSEDEVHYLAKVYPQNATKVSHPVLQCAHCATVNFPGTDAGIVEMSGDRMVSRSGRRMFERDYRAVTKHVSPLCEGTPLNVMTSVITRSDVDLLVDFLGRGPEVLESEVESWNYLSQAALMGGNVGEGPSVTAPFGLYPKPYMGSSCQAALSATQEETKPASSTLSGDTSSLASMTASPGAEEVDVLAWFTFLGQFVGQALLDERLLNLPFARPFLRALRGEKLVGRGVSMNASLDFVEELDPAIANSLRYLYDLAMQYSSMQEAGDVASEKVAAWTEEVDAMCLSFALVGADDIPLEAGGGDTAVTLTALHRYVELSLEFLLERTIASQVQAFQQGFAQIYGGSGNQQLLHFLRAFDVRELEQLLSDRGTGSTMWDRDGVELREHMVCDHGYTADSRAIADLIAILCDLSIDDQRLFVRFVTGAGRLPLGGLRNLEPKLTVVRKLTERSDANSSGESDAVLPSASTCTNYLKLPDYSAREVMKRRLLYCIHEGQCSFHLS
ncbi:hypothetical protein BBJ28_00006404 [Nothophytophthora sp. Chile5]|nr:hypothetical protein BBJ28_00006404 [Nothophytophthora sp. Chile5]